MLLVLITQGIFVWLISGSKQDLNNYFNNKLIPVMEKINAPLPKGEIFTLHNVNAYQGTDTLHNVNAYQGTE
jgi:hypothetical protein